MNWGLKIESLLNTVFFYLRRRLKLTRRHYQETPCRYLCDITEKQRKRIEIINKKYAADFEMHLDLINALENYHILDLLDQMEQRIKTPLPQKARLVDIGSKNFYYARCLQMFFKPDQLAGIELDAYKMYQNFHTRLSYAQHYILNLPQTQYLAMDFLDFRGSTDIITLFLPFVVEYPLVKWTLPLSRFTPQQIFNHTFSILTEGGYLIMTNQGEEEFILARNHAQNSGFKLIQAFPLTQPLIERDIPVFVSVWQKGKPLHS